jgi:hypothetical protein
MIVNVCPSGIAKAPAEVLWHVLVNTERYGDPVFGHPPSPQRGRVGAVSQQLDCAEQSNACTPSARGRCGLARVAITDRA